MAFKNLFLNTRRGEWRNPLRKSKAFDWSCRNNGACGYCRNNRTHSNKKRELRAKELEKEICDALLEVESSINGKIKLKKLSEFIEELENDLQAL